MNTEIRTVPHPRIKDREITFLFIDNSIDLPTAHFLVHDARYGSRRGRIAGKRSHRDKAIIMGELHRHLNAMNTDWRDATEGHILAIRNSMLCWDRNGNEDPENYDYEPIRKNTVNHKLEIWFRFYKYMDKIGEPNGMVMNTKIVKIPIASNYLSHIGKSKGYEFTYKERWLIKVDPDPASTHYHAITKREYGMLEKHLKSDDLVFGMIAYLMVETGLRIDAALEVDESYFKGFLVYINAGKDLDDEIDMSFINKGGDRRMFKLPIRTIARIQKYYMAREHRRRKKLYKARCAKLNKPYNENNVPMWINKRGKQVQYRDILNAFRDASFKMGKTTDTVTPHWMRHTFATWAFIDYAKEKDYDLKNIKDEIELSFSLMLQRKMVHASPHTLKKYLATALELEGEGRTSGPIVTLKALSRDRRTQERIRDEAIMEFGNDFDKDIYDVYSYGYSRGFISKGD